MASQTTHTRVQREQESAVRRQAEFQEAPGEREAEAARATFLQRAAQSPADLGTGLVGADSATRARVVSRLQQERGNAFVQRVVAEAQGTPGRLVGQSQPEMVQEVLQRKGSGSALPDVARQPLEGHFGADLSDVRVHTDTQATDLNRELQANAFTVGSDIFFAEGQYDPHGSGGQGLLAHEVAHVGQQTGFAGAAVQREGADDEQVPHPEGAPKEEEQAS